METAGKVLDTVTDVAADAGGWLLGVAGGFIGKAVGNTLLKALVKVLDGIVGLLLLPLQTAMNILCDNIATRFVVDPADNFLTLIAGENSTLPSTFFTAFQIMGFWLLLVIAAFTIYMKIIDPLSSQGSLGSIVGRTIAGIVAVLFSYRIMYIVSTIFNGNNSAQIHGLAHLLISKNGIAKLNTFALLNLVQSEEFLSTEMFDTSLVDAVGIDLIKDFVAGCICLYLVFKIAKELLKFFIEVIERWILLNIYYILSPVAFATLPGTSTVNVVKTFVSGYITQFFIMMMNIWFIQAFVMIVNNYTPNGLKDTYGWSNITMCFIILSLLRAAQRFDNYLHDMGFAVGRTGSMLGREIASAFSLSNLSRAALTTAAMGRMAARAGTAVSSWAKASPEQRTGRDANKKASTYDYGKKGGSAGIDKSTTLGGVVNAKDHTGKGAVFGNDDAVTMYNNSIDTKGAKFSSDGNRFDSTSGKGVAKATNRDGTISTGTVSMNPMGPRSVNVSKNDTPVYFTPDVDSAPLGGRIDSNMQAMTPVSADEYKQQHAGATEMLSSMSAEDTDKVISDGKGHLGAMDEDNNFKAVFSTSDSHAFGGEKIADQRANRKNKIELDSNAVGQNGLTPDGYTQIGVSPDSVNSMTKDSAGNYRMSDENGKTIGSVVKDKTSRNADGSDSYTFYSSTDRETARYNQAPLTGSTNIMHTHMPGYEQYKQTHGEQQAAAQEKAYLNGITDNVAENAALKANQSETVGSWQVVQGSVDGKQGSFELYNKERDSFREYSPVSFDHPDTGKGAKLAQAIPFQEKLKSTGEDDSYTGLRADYTYRESSGTPKGKGTKGSRGGKKGGTP